MSAKRVLLIVLIASTVMLAVGVGPQMVGSVRALPLSKEPDTTGVTIPYPGQLNYDDGQPVTDGAYDFTFALYDVETGGTLLWSEIQRGVSVWEGAFTTSLGSMNPIPVTAADGERWLAVEVRGPGESDFTVLSPRQRLSTISLASPASTAADLACPHDHWGETWEGDSSSTVLYVKQSGAGAGVVVDKGLNGSSNTGNALEGWTAGIGAGVYGYGSSSYGVYGRSSYGNGVYGEALAAGKSGVYGLNDAGYGVTGRSANGDGVQGLSSTVGKSGVYGLNDAGYGVTGRSANAVGVYAVNAGGTKDNPALRAASTNTTNGMAAYMTNDSSYHTAHFQNTGSGGVLFLQNNGAADGSGGGDFISAVNSDGTDQQFRVLSDGAAYSDGGWQGAADFAELMTTEDDPTAYEPGDVLVISAETDRSVALSFEPYSTMVIGIYSEEPGFVGSSHAMEGQRDDEIPVAVVGIVPCKVSAENGPIHRGDLLVTSSTPGHAMRADNPSPGTILGKALSPLDAGTGTILVLATPQ